LLCDVANRFPPFAAKFLQSGDRLARRFREESVTDMLMAALMSVAGNGLTVEFPNETVTGADMQWDFVNLDRGTFFRLLIQAKRLYANNSAWTRHRYMQLLKRAGKVGPLQVETLCRTARSQPAAYPLYAFYNPGQSCRLANAVGAANVEGVNLAGGYVVESLAASATTTAQKAACKRLGTIQPHLFSLADLFCPPSLMPLPPFGYAGPSRGPIMIGFDGERTIIGFPIPPRPEDVGNALRR
jgi:hypothetical protein